MRKKFGEYFAIILEVLKTHPAEFFLLIAATFGIIIIFRMPPLTGTDEFTHFPRAYQIVEGTFWEQKISPSDYGGYLPNNINTMINDYRDLSRKSTIAEYQARTSQLNHTYWFKRQLGSKTTATFTSDAPYPPWSFAPASIGIIFAKIFNVPLIWYVYFSRISCLVVWLALTYMAIRIIPVGKWFLFVVAVLPPSITQALTIGIDGLTMGVSWLLIAMSFAAITTKTPIKKPTLLILAGLAISLALIKQGYWLVALLPFFIPTERFAQRQQAYLWKALLVLLVGVVSLFSVLRTLSITKGLLTTPRLGVYINSNQQLSYVLHHFAHFLGMVITQPFTKSYDTVYIGLVGILSNRLIYLSVLIVVLLYFGLVLSYVRIPIVPGIRQHWRSILIPVVLIYIGTYVLVSLGLYMIFSGVGDPAVEGVVGRYFLPFLPLLIVLPMASRVRLYMKDATFISLISVISTIGLVAATLAINQ